MMKLLQRLLWIGAWLPAALSAQVCRIEGTVKGVPAATVYVYNVIGDVNQVVDSVRCDAQGHFLLERARPFPGGMYFLVFTDNSYFQLLLDADQDFSLSTDRSDFVGKMKVTGSVDNALFYETAVWEADLRKRLDPVEAALKIAVPGSEPQRTYQAQQQKMVAEREAYLAAVFQANAGTFFVKFKQQGQNPRLENPVLPDGSLDTLRQTQLYKKAYWAQYDWKDERLVRTPVFANKLKTWIKDLTPQTPDSVIAAVEQVLPHLVESPEHYKFAVNWLALQYKQSTIMGGERIYVHVVDKYVTAEKASWASMADISRTRREAEWMKASMLGQTGQDLSCRNLQGGQTSLYGLNGKATIVFMYSATCEHCQKEAPVLHALTEKWKSRGLEVFALCIDPEESMWRKFVAEKQLTGWHHVIDPEFESAYYQKFWVDITPEIYVLDGNHTIVANNLHPEQVEPFLVRILGQ